MARQKIQTSLQTKFQTIVKQTLNIALAALLFTSVPAAGFTATSYAQANQNAQPAQTSNTTDKQEAAQDKPKDAAKSPENPTTAVNVAVTTPTGTIAAPAASAQTPSVTTQEAEPASGTAPANGPASIEVSATAAATPTPEAPLPGTTQNSNVQNNTTSTATSGTASVLQNEKAGNATSGSATANATVITVVGTGTGLGNTPITFVRDIYNDSGSNEIQGNITIDPNTLALINNNTNATAGRPNLARLTQGSVSMTDIENNIVLNVTSGDATIAGNGEAGNATSGDAVALANIMNLVSSSVGASRSFLGVVNIFGNLKGDILVPTSFVNNLFADNGPTPNSSTYSTGQTDSFTAGTTNITNNVNLNALSGTATVSGNGEAGEARSGDATTNLTVFNLTGREVVAKNSLLVFVNVMGKWVGMIVNAPAGSTAAALGGGIRSDNGVAAPGNHQGNTTITNNVSVNATSGNAAVMDNGEAGDATSGNAKAGANILNFVHSSFNLDDWFGALFINVIGSWLGNFGIADDTPTVAQPAPAPASVPSTGKPVDAIEAVRVYQFNTDTGFTPATVEPAAPAELAADSNTSRPTDAVLASTTKAGEVLGSSSASPQPALPQFFGGQDMVSFATMVAGVTLLAVLSAIITRRYRRVGK